MLLGIALVHLDDLQQALVVFDRAIELNESDPLFYLNYAIVMFNHDNATVRTFLLPSVLIALMWRLASLTDYSFLACRAEGGDGTVHTI